VRLGPGLGLITRLIIDQHFSQRERLGRLLAAVALEPTRLGVGIDQDTAIVYYGNATWRSSAAGRSSCWTRAARGAGRPTRVPSRAGTDRRFEE